MKFANSHNAKIVKTISRHHIKACFQKHHILSRQEKAKNVDNLFYILDDTTLKWRSGGLSATGMAEQPFEIWAGTEACMLSSF